MPGAFADQRVDDALGFDIGDVGALPFFTQDDGGFGEVGREDVRFGGELGHSLAQLGGVGGVDLAVVGHHGIYHA